MNHQEFLDKVNMACGDEDVVVQFFPRELYYSTEGWVSTYVVRITNCFPKDFPPVLVKDVLIILGGRSLNILGHDFLRIFGGFCFYHEFSVTSDDFDEIYPHVEEWVKTLEIWKPNQKESLHCLVELYRRKAESAQKTTAKHPSFWQRLLGK